jgi:hypothetical protein
MAAKYVITVLVKIEFEFVILAFRLRS